MADIQLTAFVRGYLECALFSSTDDNGEPFDGLYSVDDIAESSILSAIEECAAFQQANEADLVATDSEDAWNGHDFWLTQNRHGAGFWDRGYPNRIGERLTDASHDYGELSVYLSDSEQMIYIE